MDLAGVLNLQDVNVTANQVGQRVIYDGIQRLLDAYNAELEAATRFLIQRTTTEWQRKYALPGSREMEEMGVGAPSANPAARKRTGTYDVGFDLRDARIAIGWDDITLAKLSIEDISSEVAESMRADTRWRMKWLLNHIFDNANNAFDDPQRGPITVRRFANQDGTEFPETAPGGASGQDDHYLVSGYAASSVSDANNPFTTLRNEVLEHYSVENDMAFFVSEANMAKYEALTGYIEVDDPNITRALGTEYLQRVIGNLPGRVRGRIKNQGWVVEWGRIPDDYIYAQNLNAPAPIVERVDAEADIAGFRLIPGQQGEYPLDGSTWRDRRGFGVQERLAGAVMLLAASGSYVVPDDYDLV